MDARLRGGKDFRVDLFVFETEMELYDAAGGDVRRQQVGFSTSHKGRHKQERALRIQCHALLTTGTQAAKRTRADTPLLVQN